MVFLKLKQYPIVYTVHNIPTIRVRIEENHLRYILVETNIIRCEVY